MRSVTVTHVTMYFRVIDTTNRSHVMEALRDGFDPDGFRNGRPLKRDLFYMNPFITCQWCVNNNTIDAAINILYIAPL